MEGNEKQEKSKIELKKINEYTWEIPKTGKMNVPAVIFASEKLIRDMQKDNTFQQVKNVATLPGIVGKSIAMPDAHLGYGFSIGGVAAFDLDKGVISPGGVGYDIDCLSGNSKILSDLGYWRKIKDFDTSCKDKLCILNKPQRKLETSEIALILNKKSDNILKIKTDSGFEISATAEHPFFTKNGMKKIGEINNGEEVLLYPFEGVEYESPKEDILVSEKDIDSMNRSLTSKLQIKKVLKKAGLLPLFRNDSKLGLIIKIMGFIFGDGCLSLGKNNQIGFYGKEEDLYSIKKDLKTLGFDSFIFSRKRKHHIRSQYKEFNFEVVEFSLHCRSSALAVLLKLLGTPSGNKTRQDYSLPLWLLNSPRWHQRLFLAALFGAELSKPKTLTNHNFCLYPPVLSMNKENILHGINFLNEISYLLSNFGIKSSLIKNRVDEVNGKQFNRLRLLISSEPENLISLYSKIGYEYNFKKKVLANAAVVWLKKKEQVRLFRERVLKKSREMKNDGFTKSFIIQALESPHSNKFFIDKALYNLDYGRTGSRIAFSFITFNEFVKKYSYGAGFIWDSIKSKEVLEQKERVYDFTINNDNHNFFADSFVVSNCSVRLLSTNIKTQEFLKKRKEILHAIFRSVPSGVGRGGKFQVTYQELDNLLKGGAEWAVNKGYGDKEDLKHLEDGGKLTPCNPEDVSKRAKSRGIGQVGTLGSGNHFLEIQKVDKIFDEKIAKDFGIEKDNILIMIHCGSRGLGHQVASDYIMLMEKEYGFKNLPDRELINAPISSELGKKYLSAMNCAANFAFANKQIITQNIREQLKYYFPKSEIKVVYEVCHNIAKIEEHIFEENGKKVKRKVCVHRKGATRAFENQPVLIPGSMGTASYVLVGTKKAEEISFASTAHGAGRVESRTKARKELTAENIKKELEKKDILVEAGSSKGLVEEAPEVYKDIDEVVRVSHELGIGKLVARVVPLAVMKG
jgi:tRNA-splicing ligase RtcB